ncbi:MAG: type II CAAX endopeptidase family protein [Thermodesulfobacteriota bacterium]
MTGRHFHWLHVAGTVALAAVFWFVTFYLTWSTFWIKISLSAASLAVISLRLQPDPLKELKFDLKSILIGVLSAAALYFIFWLGKKVSTTIFPFAEHQIGSIYGKGEGTPMGVIAALLFFVTGPSEELYWRGFLQRNLSERFGARGGWLLATAVYAGVHVWSFNFMLIGAAAVAGAFWGAIYRRLNNLAPVIISHSIWSTVVFAVLPIP